jgi:thiol-disulfide isomerase/thioredoxin
MKTCSRIFCAALAVLISFLLPLANAADNEPARAAPTPFEIELKTLVEKFVAKVRQGQTGAAAFAAESAEFDALFAKYHGQREAEAAILINRAAFASAALRDESAMKAILERIAKDYADTKEAATAQRILTAMTPEARAAQQARADDHAAKAASLLGKPAAEIEFTWSTRDGLKKLSDLRGNVVVLDFWATWCGPCIASFPNVRKKVEHFRGSPVVFLGITSLQGRIHNLQSKPIDVKDDPAREYALTAEFRKKYEMTWDIAFSAQKVFNPDYAVNGIPSVAIIAPDGSLRGVAIHPAAGEAEIDGKIIAILQEFKLPVPAATH